jgi:hypothetical protein
LKTKRVETIGGTGKLEDFNGSGGSGLTTALRSPGICRSSDENSTLQWLARTRFGCLI